MRIARLLLPVVPRATRLVRRARAAALLCVLVLGGHAGDAAAVELPAWVKAAAADSAVLPESEKDANAVALMDQNDLVVQANGTVTRHRRVVYRILRPAGTAWGSEDVPYSTGERITLLHGWGQSASGVPYEVTDKQAVDTAVLEDTLATDQRERTLTLPGVSVGSLVAFEWTVEDRAPLLDADEWDFQEGIPERSVQYTLELPPGWAHSVTWHNHVEVAPSELGPTRWRWSFSEVSAVPGEPAMPSLNALAGRMHVSFSGPGAKGKSFASWAELGAWQLELNRGRDDPTPAISESAAAATAGITEPLARIAAVARLVQTQVRYVAIVLGIGGYQPHPAGEVLAKRYGDCKDHSALLVSMLKAIGIRSYYVLVNTQRGVVQDMPAPENEFDHVIIAIQLPPGVAAAPLGSVQEDPALGRLLYFDSTNSITPLGRLSADLQGSYGLMVAPDGSRLVRLPQQAAALTGIHRTGKWTLDDSGKLAGNVTEILEGDRADLERGKLLSLANDGERAKLLDSKLAGALASYEVTQATIGSAKDSTRPVEWHYSFETERYAQTASDLLLVRPAVLGARSVLGLSTDRPRHNPVLLLPGRDTDEFQIAIPAGYRVEELPPAVDRDESFASYHSRTIVKDGMLRYSRQMEIRVFEVAPVDVQRLWSFARAIDSDVRSVATLSRSAAPGSPSAGAQPPH
jgi:hypothetical protein